MSYRPAELRGPIEDAKRERRTVHLADIKFVSPTGGVRYLDVHVSPLLDAADAVGGVSIVFDDETGRVALYDELARSREELETAYEELQASNEELETTNEELETTNEELQSANEELETMNEELQSTNEELNSINTRLRDRGDEVKRANQFLESVLASLRQATLVIDKDMRVILWNEIAQDLWGLRAEEVLGQFFLNLDIGLPVDQLRRPIRLVLRGEADQQAVELDAVNRRGKPIRCRVVARPILDDERAVEGLLLLLEEVR
jgi:two-component system CheB/CheR fusion protein